MIEDLQPATLVIFGITGNLAYRKLLPALYDLAKRDMLPKPFKILGVTRTGSSVPELLGSIRKSVEEKGKTVDQPTLEHLGSMLEIVTMDLLVPAEYKQLKIRLDAIETQAKVCMNRLFYLAIPAQSFVPVVRELGTNGLNQACPHGTGAALLLIEKPFGYNLASAQELVNELNKHFAEEQIYRIDHYLAKETAQNILNFRFQNPIFKHTWDNRCISHILITVSEQQDIEKRVAFYEQTGALRDVLQSHMLQLLALTTMEEPHELTAEHIHEQKLKLLRSIVPVAPDKVASLTVRGQYEGYRRETGNPNSLTETYAAIRLDIDNDRWRGVPMLLRTGKALAESVAEIVVVFADHGGLASDNILTIRIQPNEGISLQLLAKKPGFTNEVEPVQMDFCYDMSFRGNGGAPDAYERVLRDAFRGDKTLFATSDEVLASWHILDNVIHEWSKDNTGLEQYARESWGPKAAASLAETADITWPVPDLNICRIR